MRVWDVSPGFLNDQSLLGEHRELHGIVSIIRNNKKGYSRHPETLRWVGFGWALRQRHRLLSAEMALRNFKDQTPVLLRAKKGHWPVSYIDTPAEQFRLLKTKYINKPAGRIPLPKNTQTLWAQHKYSVLARNTQQYEKFGRQLAGVRGLEKFSETAAELTEILRVSPTTGGIRNALQHMWGYLSDYSHLSSKQINCMDEKSLLHEIQALSRKYNVSYLLSSTALSELAAWLD